MSHRPSYLRKQSLNIFLLFACLAFNTNANEFDCLIEPNVVTEVSSPANGVASWVAVESNDIVKKGQVLLTLDSNVEKASVNLARARSKMESDIEAKKSSLAFAKRRLERIDDLYKKKAVSFDQRDEVETEVNTAKAELKLAEENKRIAELELKRAIAQLNKRTIRSPINGVVVKRQVSAGESVEEKSLFKLAQINPLNVEVIASINHFGKVKKGMNAIVEPESPVGGEYKATVTIVDKVLDAATGTFGFRLEMPNPDHKLPAGLKCKVHFVQN